MADHRWRAVDDFLGETLVPPDADLDAALAAGARAGLPAIEVSAPQGKLLHLLARATGARRILELGTLAGYSTIWLGRALAPGGRLVSLELSAEFAEVARASIARAGLADRVEVLVGPALETLPALAGEPPFDLVFIDADKAATPEYFAWSLRLTREGSLIVVDNVVRGGALADREPADPGTAGMRRFHRLAAAEPRVSATTIQTVGCKGYDGFTLALVTGAPAGGGSPEDRG